MSNVTPIDLDDYSQDGLDGLEEHDLAGLVPEMAPDEYDKLVEDIRKNGLMEPIVLFDDQILDGRHRHRAFRDHRDEWGREWEPAHFVEFKGAKEEARLRVTENVQRRHLTKPGLAVVACTIYLDEAKEEAAERQASSGEDEDFDETGESYDIAASKVSGVSGRSVREIDNIRQDDDLQDVWQDLLKGRFKFISEATELSKFDEDERQQIREKWENQRVDKKDWKDAFESVSDDSEKPSEQVRKFKRLRRGVNRVISALDDEDAIDELPTLKEKKVRKRTEYKNFLESLLEDLEARVA